VSLVKTHHAFLGGFVGGLLLSTETLVVAVVFFALGAGAVFVASKAAALIEWARGLFERRVSSGGDPPLEERIREYSHDADPRGSSWW
jgi:hypothetical protein